MTGRLLRALGLALAALALGLFGFAAALGGFVAVTLLPQPASILVAALSVGLIAITLSAAAGMAERGGRDGA